MGYQVIKQPDGKLAVWSSITEGWCACDLSAEDAVEFLVEIATGRARRSAHDAVAHIVADEPGTAYFQFAMSYDEAEFAARDGEKLAERRAQWAAAGA